MLLKINTKKEIV